MHVTVQRDFEVRIESTYSSATTSLQRSRMPMETMYVRTAPFKNHMLIIPRCSRKRLAQDVNVYPEFGRIGQPEVIVGC